MRNVWALFKGDMNRMGQNVVTAVIIVGLIVLPSLFSWYNIIACWNVFDNTGNLTVAVANADEGYESDLLSMDVNIGDQIESALRANNQLNWLFTDEEDAVEGVRSGRYYAAVVIPSNYSRDMMSFYSSDVQHASITYYSNQKKSAIAPKVTDQGADQVAAQVNQVFAQTISEIVLGVASSLVDYADQANTSGGLGSLIDHVARLGDELDAASSALGSYSNVISSSRLLIGQSQQLVLQARSSIDNLSDSIDETRAAANEARASLDAAQSSLDEAVANMDKQYDLLPGSVDHAFDSAQNSAAEAEALLRLKAAEQKALGNEKESEELTQAADSIKAASDSTQASRQEAQELALQAQADLKEAQKSYDENVKPALDRLEEVMAETDASLAEGSKAIRAASSSLAGATDDLLQKMEDSQNKLDAAAYELTGSATKLSDLSDSMADALSSGNVEMLQNIIGSDPAALASALSAPVSLERIAVYPVQNFGSAMAPLYTTLALWIGALLIMVALKITPSERSLRELENPTPRQVFFGRFLSVAVLSLLQSTMLAVGNLLFLGVQAESPLLYLICFWVSGLVFAFIIYTLVALFANLGKALSVVLLIVQVGGGGGSFPMQLLPQFFQDMNPFLPVARAVNAMRAAMFGVYSGDFWIQLGLLLLFVVPFALAVIFLQKPLSHIVPRFVERVEKSKLM